MGWWAMGKHGGIGGFLDEALEDDSVKMYMGDGPADIMDAFLSEMKKAGFMVTRENLQKVLLEGDYIEVPEGSIHDAFFKLHMDLVQEWRENWKRNPYPEELQGCINFCGPK